MHVASGVVNNRRISSPVVIMLKLDISKYAIMIVTMVVIMVTMVRVWQVMVKKHDCEMTWMFERANFTRIFLPSDVQELYPTYGLYFYGEG